MNDDKISEEERQLYKEKVEKLVSAQNARIKKEGEDYIDAGQIKDMLDQMVQIDSDPTSEKAKSYYKQLAEIEKSNKKVKAVQNITIKTQRGGKTERITLDAFGN